MNFTEILVAIVVGWTLGMASTWLILARTLPWLDVKMLPKQGGKPALPVQKSDSLLNRPLNPALDVVVPKM